MNSIPIHAEGAPPGCGACLHQGGQPVCRAALGHDCLAPVLQGPLEVVRQVLAALGPSLGFDGTLANAGAGQVVSLSVRPGEEADLVLAGDAHCGAALADAAFQALRRLLPDTDIYVRHAG